MRNAYFLLCTILALALLALPGCTDRPGLRAEPGAFRVTFTGNSDLGSVEKPLPFQALKEQSFQVDIEALRNDLPDQIDEGFEGMVVLSVLPFGRTAKDPHWVLLSGGRATRVQVGIRKAYGPVRLVARDVGYWPSAKASEAACNNGLDDDGDGQIDAPKDRGCFYGDDDNETGGSGAVGASPTIYFANPRLADIGRPGPNMEDASVLAGSRVTVDRGLMLVSRVSTDGMYITDYDGAKWDPAKGAWSVDVQAMSYRSIFAFNFSTPLNIGEGDCLVQLDGTVEEFYGFTELGKPTWKKGDYAFCAGLARAAGLAECAASEEADSAKRPPPCRSRIEELANTPFDLTRLTVDEQDGKHSAWDQRWPGTETERFEASLVMLSEVDVFTELWKCDRNGNGVIDFSDNDEKNCSNDCGDSPTCQVAESYYRYSQWTVNFIDGVGQPVEVNVSSIGSIPKFDPLGGRMDGTWSAGFPSKLKLKPLKLHRLIGTMRHLSFGRPSWIIEPRRPDDCQLPPDPAGKLVNCNNK